MNILYILIIYGFNKIKWNDGEANLDTEYSILACNCCEDAWKIIQNDNIELKNF